MRAWLFALVLVGCGKSAGTMDNPDSATGGSGDGATSGDGAVPPGWEKLVTRTWSLSPGQQDYYCRRIQVPSDMWITGFRPLSPIGTHHEVVTIDPNGSQSGDFHCNASTGTLNTEMVFAGGVNTDDLMFPSGVAVHLAAGQWITLNLHLFDLGDMPITGESGVLVKTIPQSQVVNEADAMFAGTFNISVPSDGQPHTAQGGCTAPTDWHMFTLWPHMHQTATHQKMVVTHSSVPTTMLDVDYQFMEQKNYPMPETIIHAGDQVTVTCTYVNTTGTTITFGDSSNSEMCFTGMYKYPKSSSGSTFGCTSM